MATDFSATGQDATNPEPAPISPETAARVRQAAAELFGSAWASASKPTEAAAQPAPPEPPATATAPDPSPSQTTPDRHATTPPVPAFQSVPEASEVRLPHVETRMPSTTPPAPPNRLLRRLAMGAGALAATAVVTLGGIVVYRTASKWLGPQTGTTIARSVGRSAGATPRSQLDRMVRGSGPLADVDRILADVAALPPESRERLLRDAQDRLGRICQRDMNNREALTRLADVSRRLGDDGVANDVEAILRAGVTGGARRAN